MIRLLFAAPLDFLLSPLSSPMPVTLSLIPYVNQSESRNFISNTSWRPTSILCWTLFSTWSTRAPSYVLLGSSGMRFRKLKTKTLMPVLSVLLPSAAPCYSIAPSLPGGSLTDPDLLESIFPLFMMSCTSLTLRLLKLNLLFSKPDPWRNNACWE